MKQRIINILSAIFQTLDTLLCRLHIKHPKVIIYMDGGICSQMQMYAQGKYYAQRGLDVRYDTRWYSTCGKDQYGIMPREFELTDMWPKLEFKTLSKWQRKWYLLFFSAKHIDEDWLPQPSTIKHSLYFYGYWDLRSDEYMRLFMECFNKNTAAIPSKWSNMSFEGIVGIHVRRGDLAKGDNPVYGGVTDGYFERAIEFCSKRFNPKEYLFFSDEPDWVENNICNQLKKPYVIIRGNKAWEDFWLLMHCPIIVASQGSFGKIAARLNPEAVLIQCDNNHANRERQNTYYIK